MDDAKTNVPSVQVRRNLIATRKTTFYGRLQLNVYFWIKLFLGRNLRRLFRN